MNKINWRKELLDSSKFNEKEENFLKHDAKFLSQSCLLGALGDQRKNHQDLSMLWVFLFQTVVSDE